MSHHPSRQRRPTFSPCLCALLLAASVAIAGPPARADGSAGLATVSVGERCRNLRGLYDGALLSAICEASRWIGRGALSAEVSQDGAPAIKLWRNGEGSALDVDFNDRVIGAGSLLRMLSGDDVLPMARFKRVIVRRARVTGQLMLHDVSLDTAVMFKGVGFNVSQSGSCDYIPEKSNAPRTAISVVGSHFKRRFVLESSVICGDLDVRGSVFGASFEILGGGSKVAALAPILVSMGASEAREDSRQIHGRVAFQRNALQNVGLNDVFVLKNFAFEENEALSLRLDSVVIADDVDVKLNRIKTSLHVHDVWLLVSSRRFEISDNTVDGPLNVGLRALSPALERPSISRNHVGGASKVVLPACWSGMLHLRHAHFASLLTLDQHDQCDRPFTKGVIAAAAGPNAGTAVGEDVVRTCGVDNHALNFAGAAPSTVIDLTSTEVDTLVWNLPRNRRYLWRAPGFRYANWGGERKGQAAEHPVNHLMSMRHQLDCVDGDTLHYMADYFATRGRFIQSRAMLREAKQLNYDSDGAGNGTHDRIARKAAFFLLWPVGFGAYPEWSLVWFLAVWVVFYVLYVGYHHVSRWRGWNPGSVPNMSKKAGFMQFDDKLEPKDFRLILYSFDAMLPVIDLHAYSRYYPRSAWMRSASAVQHFLGWVLITIFLISGAIL